MASFSFWDVASVSQVLSESQLCSATETYCIHICSSCISVTHLPRNKEMRELK